MKKFYSILTVLAFVLGLSQYGNAQCDTLRNWDPADLDANGVYYYNPAVGGWGAYPGHCDNNGTGLVSLAYAERLEHTTGPNEVRFLRYAALQSDVVGAVSDVTFIVYEHNAVDNAPGATIASETVSMADIDAGMFNTVELSNPPTVSGLFWIGFELEYDATQQDTLLLAMTDTRPGGTDGYLINIDNIAGWINSGVINITGSIVLEALLSNSNAPTLDFQLDGTTLDLCLGGAWDLDGSISSNNNVWDWELWSLDGQGDLDQLVDTDSGSPSATLTPNATGEYNMYLISTQDCNFNVQGYGAFEVFPAFTYDLTVTDELCNGGNGSIEITNMAGGPGDFYYSWTSPLYIAQGTSGDTTGLEAGTFNIQFGSGELDGNQIFIYTGCDVEETVTINNIPGEQVSVGQGSTICAGDQATLTASGNGTIAWTTSGGSPVGTGTSIQVSPTTTTSYIATLTDNNNCTDQEFVTVTVNTENASFTFNDFCEGSSNNFPTNINTTGGTFSFNPVPSDGAQIDPNNGTITNETLGSTYTVQYVIGGDCPDTQTQSVTITSADNPAFDYQAPCDGNTIIASNIVTPGGTFSFAVAPGAGETIDPSSGLITGAQVGTVYQVNYQTPAGACQDNLTQSIEIFPLPNVEANASETLVCSGEEVTLTATGSSISYDWSGVGNGAVQTVNPTATQNYIVTGTDANGCQNTDQVNVAVNPLPTVNAGSNITVCEGTEVTLTANAPTATTVSWTGGVVDGEAFTPSTGTTTYTVTVEDANGCENTDDVNVTVEQGPATNAGDNQTTCVNYGPISLSGTPTGGTFSGPGVANNEFDPAAAGVGTHEITYVVQSSAGCDGFATMTIVVDECLSVNEYGGLDNLILMPNPARDYVDIVVSENVNVKSIEVISVTGQVVTTSVASNGNTHRVDLSSVNTGAYFVRITSDEEQTTRKIVVK